MNTQSPSFAGLYLLGEFGVKYFRIEGNGGANRDRTDDLLNAIQALSQLSYGPTKHRFAQCVGPSISKLRADSKRKTLKDDGAFYACYASKPACVRKAARSGVSGRPRIAS